MGSGLRDELTNLSEESYRACVSGVCVCVHARGRVRVCVACLCVRVICRNFNSEVPGPEWAIAPQNEIFEPSIFHIVTARLFLKWNNGLKIPTS